MKEKEIRQKLKEKLGKYGLLWFPPHVKFYENDIFGVFDCVFYNGMDVYWIQLTTKSHLSHRRKKIAARFTQFTGRPPANSQIYAWDEKNNNFVIENV